MTNLFSDFLFQRHQASVHDANSEYMFMAAVNTAKKSGRTGRATFRAYCLHGKPGIFIYDF